MNQDIEDRLDSIVEVLAILTERTDFHEDEINTFRVLIKQLQTEIAELRKQKRD